MKAIMVAVDYSDLLAVTLPYNRHHFEEVVIVTSFEAWQSDRKLRDTIFDTKSIAFATNAFYDDGAAFNKWKALEQGLDAMGRDGWICVMDADVLWPKKVPPAGYQTFQYQPGFLYTPRRRMWEEWPQWPGWVSDPPPYTAPTVPPESLWKQFPLHRQQREFAGYSQIFHASDPHLGLAPWHQTDWKHAGGADSFFQAKWPEERKVRPPFECLHLGPAGQNWFGRATPLADGTVLPESERRRKNSSQDIWAQRRLMRAQGLDQFAGEKIVKEG